MGFQEDDTEIIQILPKIEIKSKIEQLLVKLKKLLPKLKELGVVILEKLKVSLQFLASWMKVCMSSVCLLLFGFADEIKTPAGTIAYVWFLSAVIGIGLIYFIDKVILPS